LICDRISIIERLLVNELIIQNFKEFKTEIKDLYETCKLNKEGNISNAIPELEKANPESFGVSVCSIDGQRYNIGDSDVKFSV
jgi:glutaminase